MDTPPSPTPPVTFTIVSQRHERTYDPANPSGSQWEITFKASDGTESFVTVPDHDYNAETVARLITERVRQIESIAQLGQTPATGQ